MTRIQDDLRKAGFDRSARLGVHKYVVKCSCCEALVINGIPTHERGCPNAKRRTVEDDE